MKNTYKTDIWHTWTTIETQIYASGVVDIKPSREAKMVKARKDDILDSSARSAIISDFEEKLSAKIVGQPGAVDALTNAYRTFTVGLTPPNRPIAVLLFAGSTGVGKTRACEAAAEIISGNPHAITKIDCAEFRHSHEIAKLIGAPPGYLGFKEVDAILAQNRIDKHQKRDEIQPNFILFDEIEKAHEALWSLLLGIFDKGILTLGNSNETDFSHSIIIMTTNLGTREMERILKGGNIGFMQRDTENIEAIADTAVRGNFTPEFMNRIDTIVIFKKLEKEHLKRIFEIEMCAVQERIIFAKGCPIFHLGYSDEAADYILQASTDPRYGAREIKRAIERLIIQPVTNLISSKQIKAGDNIKIDATADGLVFIRDTSLIIKT